MIIKNAKVFQEDGSFVQEDVMISGGVFASRADGSEVVDASGCFAVPGLIDIHQHGCIGHDYSDSDIGEIDEMARWQAKAGVTAVYATTLTLPIEHLEKAFSRIIASNDPSGASFIGIHAEGPFLSGNKVGAQNPAYIGMPNKAALDRMQAAADGRVKIMTIAPEIEGALELVEAYRDSVVFCMAHTVADYDIGVEAINRGVSQLTHIFNAMPGMRHRDPGVIGAAQDSDSCFAQIICDGKHVHPSMVRASFRMFGDDRIILISDSMMATGLPDGDYELGGLQVTVKDNEARITSTGALAGSILNLMDMVLNTTSWGIPFGIAVKCACVNPAKAMGVFDERGSISVGKIADLVLLSEDDLSVRDVFLRGKKLS